MLEAINNLGSFELKKIIVLCASALLWTASHAAETLAVLPIKSISDQASSDMAPAVYELVSQAFAKVRRFSVVERGQLATVLNELKLQNSGIIDENTAASIGQQAGAKRVVLTTLTGTTGSRLDDQYDKQGRVIGRKEVYLTNLAVSARFVDVQTGIVGKTLEVKGGAWADSVPQAKQSALSDLRTKLDRELVNNFPLGGYVIKTVGSDSYLIDIGSESGVANEDVFLIYSEGEDILHPVNGKVIKGERKVVGEGQVIAVQQELATIKITKADGPIVVGQSKVESKPKARGFWEALKDLGT